MEYVEKIFSGNLSRLLGAKGVSQKAFADFMGVSQPTVGSWLTGEKMPRMRKIDRICEFFGVTRSEIMEAPNSDPFKTLSEREKFVIKKFRELSETDKQWVLKFIKSCLVVQESAAFNEFMQNN